MPSLLVVVTFSLAGPLTWFAGFSMLALDILFKTLTLLIGAVGAVVFVNLLSS